MSTPKISVIVPVYKVEKYLDKCVDSIINQTFTDIEILLVDDGSPDICGKMCDDWVKKDSRIKVIHKENGGLSDARNAGFEASVGEYVIFIDSDDFIEYNMLEVLYTLVTEHSADISVCGICNCYETYQQPQYPKDEILVLNGEEALKEVLRGERMPGGVVTRLIRRDLLNNHKFIVGKTYEDAFFTPRLFLSAKKIAVTTKSYYYYWHRNDSITTLPFNQKAMDVVDAYNYTYQIVEKECPQLEDLALFRIQWANFIVLDRMLLVDHYKNLPQYRDVVKYLKKNWLSIFKSPYFRKGRRISALALKLNISFYKALSYANNRRNKEQG
ncbi:MAG: glycosyltransferase [Clostridia bacterium]|nr:glycosyltransferase [Clostridia bacterium]